mgnify:CR=1 FL=1
MKKNCSFSVTRNDLFIDSYTLYDVYNCIIYDKPVISRYIHFSGNCLKASCFLNVRYGITIREMISQLGGFVKIPATVIINGRIVGNAVNSLDVPITKYVKSIAFLSKDKATDKQIYSCINCGSCAGQCPVSAIAEA